MLDFMLVSAKRNAQRGWIEIYPKFIIGHSEDLMIRGGDFYAIWNESSKLWSTSEEVAIKLIDKELDDYAKSNASKYEDVTVKVMHMWDSETGMIDKWHKYVQKQQRDCYSNLDERVIFANEETSKTDYASKKLSYPIENMPITSYEELVNVLYSPEERSKIEWAIGSIVSGDSKNIQKFLVMYGAAGTGKSTILNIIQTLFEGYYSVFDAKALGSSNSSFALEAFKANPLVAIQHDGDLSRIEDNTRLNSVVSHELMTVNEKFKSTYSNRFKCFLFMGTNKPVKITDAKSGIIRRLIDVTPTGEKIPSSKYKILISRINYELPGIAYHCLQVYNENPNKYDNYIPISMMGASNDFYNFILDSADNFNREDSVTLKVAWEMYKNYCDYAKVSYPYSYRPFKEELKNYFKDYKERAVLDDGTRVRSLYSGFDIDKYSYKGALSKSKSDFVLNSTVSILDELLADNQAQYSNDKGTPNYKWSDVSTKLRDLDTTKEHYVKVPQNHIVIDFDLVNDDGEKDFDKNAEAASKWPPTYSELSRSGKAIHLHYIYKGDVSKLSRVYGPGIEIKVYTGNSALRRKLSRCNTTQLAEIAEGCLPLRKEKEMINFEGLKNERAVRTFVAKNLSKSYLPSTKQSVDFIKHGLDQAYESGISYDVSDLRPDIVSFAGASSHNSQYCLKLIKEMQFKSEDRIKQDEYETNSIVFFDVEVFPNLFVIVWKKEDCEPIELINPSPMEIENLIRYKLVGFNNRRYDNHILYARLLGYSNEELYKLSHRIVTGFTDCMFGEAYNLSYADIYDYSSEKQSLKKFEIDLGIHHQELGMPWDKPVPEEKWKLVADYCINDVLATEALYKSKKRQADLSARKILAEISGLTVNDTTRMHATKIIFGSEKHPALNYTDLSTMFQGYTFDNGVSTYRGENPGEGGYVYANPGMYFNVALLDIASMHPSSILALNLFGDYTKNYKALLDARINIKHHNFDIVKTMLNGAFEPYLKSEEDADSLSKALKLVINSVYGYTSAKFENPFRDVRNKDNIVAKRGSLFMINLKHEVEARGFTVAHIKTDSIKIPNATPEIVDFVQEYGRKYGYNFEHEAVYERMCLVNNAVYIAKWANAEYCKDVFGYVPEENEKNPEVWTPTGAQFAQPYVFKTLFSKEPIIFEDMCETKEVQTSIYLDYNEKLGEDEHNYSFVGKVGLFCPVLDGKGGGILLREKDGKYSAVTGTKGYRWLESETVKAAGLQSSINVEYYRKLVDDAIDEIAKYGDPESFIGGY